MASGVQVTVRGSANIAVIKYWGKRDEKLNLPINSSLSGTLDQEQLSTVTTAYTAPDLVEDELYINNERQPVSSNRRLVACLEALRAAASSAKGEHDGAGALSPSWRLRIVSRNNFPTAAGLASSASGFCCLVYAVAKLWGLDDDMGFLSTIARQGSGSACRSLFGGWVRWTVGTLADGSDSRASLVADHLHWPEMRVLVLVVSDKRKDVPSTDGMQRTVASSPMIPERIRVVPERMEAMERAILARDYDNFAQLTMLDSDHFHELCHTTVPAIHYMNDVSRAVVALVRAFNATPGGMKVAYTFDAGPNAVLYLREQHLLPTLALLLAHFPRAAIPDSEFLSNAVQLEHAKATPLPELAPEIHVPTVEPDSIKYIISTRVGDGPTVLDDSHSLIDGATALPKE